MPAADLGAGLVGGALPRKRESSRLVTAWKTAKVMSETQLQTDAVARSNGVPVTLLPAEWTAMMTEFERMHGTNIHDDRLPERTCCENFAERLADGTLKAEPLALIVSAFEEEHQDARKPNAIQAMSRRRRLAQGPTTQNHDEPLVVGSNETARKVVLQRLRQEYIHGLSWTSYWIGTTSTSTRESVVAR